MAKLAKTRPRRANNLFTNANEFPTPITFEVFRVNPEEFLAKVASNINEQKATIIIEHLVYNHSMELA
jgi:type III restriction enzyme